MTALELRGGGLLLRRWRPADRDELFAAVRESLAEIGPWLPWAHPGYELSESEAWLAGQQRAWSARESWNFAVRDDSDGRLLGGCGLNHPNHLHRFANLGYWVRTSAAGRGIATTASALVARYGFDALGFVRIEIVVEPENRPSLRVAEKLGATREGLLRHRLYRADAPRDAILYSLLPSDPGRKRTDDPAGNRDPLPREA